jgi:hypothetical protein
MFGWLVGRPRPTAAAADPGWIPGGSVKRRESFSATAGDDDGTVDLPLPRGPNGGAMIALTAPNLSFIAGHPASAGRMALFEEVGFRFDSRFVGMAEVATATNPVALELFSLDELVALQRRLGCPIRLEDGVLEITT